MSTRRKTTPPPPPPNISQLARDFGVSRETIRKLRANGIDLTDGTAIADGLAASKASHSATIPAMTSDGETYSEARRRREIANADRAEIITQREAGSLIEVADVEALFSQLGAELRSRLLSMRGDLVVELEGRTGPQIFAILDNRICELLESIHENQPLPKP